MLGIFIGIVLFGNVLQFVFTNYHNLACFCFIGLILGTVPSIIHEAKVAGQTQGSPLHDMQFNPRLRHIIALLLTFSFSIYLIALEFSGNVYFMQSSSASFGSLVIAGAFMSVGIVVPGISSTVILMLIGKYSLYLSAVSSLNLSVLVPMGIGLAVGGLVLLILIKFSFKYFRKISYFAIIGFVLGSIPVLFPNNLSSFELIIGFGLILFCALLVITIEKGKVCK